MVGSVSSPCCNDISTARVALFESRSRNSISTLTSWWMATERASPKSASCPGFREQHTSTVKENQQTLLHRPYPDVAVIVEQDVAGFEVAVDHLSRVHVRQRLPLSMALRTRLTSRSWYMMNRMCTSSSSRPRITTWRSVSAHAIRDYTRTRPTHVSEHQIEIFIVVCLEYIQKSDNVVVV